MATTRKRQSRKALRGGAPLAKGSQGSVETIEEERNGSTHILGVIKTTSRTVALREQELARRLAAIDPDQHYTIYGRRFEIPEEGERDKHGNPKQAQIYMPYGGKPVLKTIEDLLYSIQLHKRQPALANKINFTQYYTKIKQFTIEELEAIIKAFDDLLTFMHSLAKAGIMHKDIHSANLVWDGGRLRLIDWGEAVLKGETDSKGRDLFEKLGENNDLEALDGEITSLRSYIEFIEKHNLLSN
jgi:hypothetical protein